MMAILPASASAAATQAEIQVIAPQLSQAITALSSTTANIRMRMEVEDQLFDAYSRLLGAWSVRLSQSPSLSETEVANMRNSLANMNSQISASVTWRSQVNTFFKNVTGIIGNISSLLSQAA